MKAKKNVLSLALALAAILATTGCKHKSNPSITKLPTHGAAVVGSGTGDHDSINAAQPLDAAQQTPTSTTSFSPGTLPTASFDVHDYIQDRAALASYTVHFQYDSAVVLDSEQANLSSVSQALTADPATKLLIEGHCDERGTEEYNRSLGERRALALRESLAKDGIDPMRVKTISYGKDKPVDDGHDESAWAKNRRGEFILLHPKGAALAAAQ